MTAALKVKRGTLIESNICIPSLDYRLVFLGLPGFLVRMLNIELNATAGRAPGRLNVFEDFLNTG